MIDSVIHRHELINSIFEVSSHCVLRISPRRDGMECARDASEPQREILLTLTEDLHRT